MLLTLRAALVAVCLAMLPGLLEGWETPKAAVVRIAGLGLLAASLVRPARLRRLVLQPLDLAIAWWLAVELIATVLSRAPLLSVFGELRQHEGLITSLALAGLYLGTRLAASDTTGARRLLDALLVGAAIASLYAFLQAAGLDPIPWSQTAMLAGQLRPFGTMGHPNLLGVLTAAAFGIALGRALEPRGARWLYAVAALVFAIATAITLSRGAWLGLGAAAVVALATTRRAGSGRIVWLAIAGVVLALGLFAWLGPTSNPVVVRMREIVSPTAGTGRTRLEVWRTAIAMWQARPWIGHGPDTLAMLFPRYQTAEYWRYEWLGLAGHAHDIYLHALATRGLLGFAAGAWAAFTLVLAARAVWTAGGETRGLAVAIVAGIAALAVSGGFGALGIAGAACTAVLMGLLGSLAAARGGTPPTQGAAADVSGKASRAQRKPRAASPAARPARDPQLAAVGRRALIAGALAGMAVAGLMAREMTMSRTLNDVYGFLGLGRPASDPETNALYAEMAARCRRVLGHAPWDDNAPAVLCETLLRSSFGVPEAPRLLAESEAAAREAVRRVPLRSANHRRLALVLAQESQVVNPGRLPEAEAEFARTVDLAPQDAVVLVEWTRTRLTAGRPSEALIPAQRAARLYPESGLALGALGEAQLANGDTASARVTLQHAAASDQGTDEGARQRANDLLGKLLAR
jgi:O-antigen ligase